MEIRRKTGSGDRATPLRPAFTLIELLVAVAIIGLLVALALPALNAAREASRDSVCRNHLRQFGVGLLAYAQRHDGKLCSGAFSWRYDGCVTEIGWVADLVNSGTAVGSMLCPTNTARVSEVYNDLLELPAADPCVDRLGRPPRKLPDGSTVENACWALQAAADKVTVVREQFYEKHYNTNYVATWFLVRSEPLLDDSGNLTNLPGTPAACPASLKSRASTVGPLTAARIDAAKLSASSIPLLGDAAAIGILSQDIGPIPQGSFVTKSFTNGPVEDASLQPLTFGGGTPHGGPGGWWEGWGKTLQDYRGLGPVHRGRCNVLMADGSVRTFRDENEDGTLNNGFGTVPAELRPEEFANKWSLRVDP